MKKCAALIKEDYEYHLYGDCLDFCMCAITKKPCLGRVISDPNNQTSQFVSRAKCSIGDKEIENCPLFGASNSIIVKLIEERLEKEKNELLREIGV